MGRVKRGALLGAKDLGVLEPWVHLGVNQSGLLFAFCSREPGCGPLNHS